MPVMNPQTEAVGRAMQSRIGLRPGSNPAPNAQPSAPQAPMGANPQGGALVDKAIQVLDMVVARLGEVNPQAAEKIGAALAQLKAAIDEAKKAGGGTPAGQTGQQPAQSAAPSAPVSKQPMSA